MDGTHRFVGIEGVILTVVLLLVNFFTIYFIVSHVMNKEISKLRNEIKDLKELLNEDH
ncbi:hypothetical protein D3C73_1183730 [compost metagenome]